MSFQGFSKRFFEFFLMLELNNNREWFQENKALYEEAVVAPMLGLIEEMGPILASISPHIVADARRMGGSMFRIYRDTRFSKDKTPYKTHAAAQFRHKLGKDVHAPGFYFHLSPNGASFGMGIWHPPADAMAKIRQAIVENGKEWEKATTSKAFREKFHLGGDSLKRPPRGIDNDHPMIEDLKRKDFYGFHEADVDFAMSADLPKKLGAYYAAGAPLVAFLCKAVEVPF